MNNIEELLKYILDSESRKTVGTVLKRIEIATSRPIDGKIVLTQKEVEDLKEQVKSVIYEQYRNLKDTLLTGKICMEFQPKK